MTARIHGVRIFVRRWRVFWVPGVFEIFAGLHLGRRSLWIETRWGTYFFDIWKRHTSDP